MPETVLCPTRAGTELYTYLPANLDLSTVLKDDWRDYAAWVVGGLYLRRHTEKQRDPDDFRPLSSAILKRVLPKRDYRHILDELIRAGVIEGNDSYWASTNTRPGWSKGYRLTPLYRDAPFRRVRLTHAELVRKVTACQVREKQEVTEDVHIRLRDAFTRLEVIADAPNDLPLARIRDRDFFFTVCEQGRVHTNLTNLSRKYRPFLRVGGQPLGCIDIVNSQPLLLGLTLTERGQALHAEVEQYKKGLVDRQNSIPPHNPFPNPTQHPTSSLPISYLGTYSDGRSNDVASYLGYCLTGKVYERLVELTGYERELVKKKWCSVVFGEPWKVERSVTGRAFAAEWPSVWAAVRSMNARDHGALARWLQTVESYHIVWRTCARLLREYPDAPLLTLHDSLVTDEDHLDAFGAALRNEFRRAYGVEVRLKTKSFA